MAKNIIEAGDYSGVIRFKSKKRGLYVPGLFGFGVKVFINKETVDHYDVVGEEQGKSFSSGVVRGMAGAAVAGGIGALAGASSAKSKGTHMVSIVFKDGKKILVTLDNSMFKNLVLVMY